MRILFTICARAGSKGVKNKNLREFLERPLSFYTVSAIDLFIKNNPDTFVDIVLNTDSEELRHIYSERISLPIELIERKADLAGDRVSKVAVIKNSYLEVKNRLSTEYDLVVDLDITSPLRTLANLEELIDKAYNGDSDVVFSVTNARRNPYFNMVKQTDNGYQAIIKSNFTARQQAPDIFDMNASMYAYKPQFLLKDKAIFDGQCDVIKMLDTAVLDIDYEEDLEMMAVIAEYLYNKYPELNEVKDNIKNILK